MALTGSEDSTKMFLSKILLSFDCVDLGSIIPSNCLSLLFNERLSSSKRLGAISINEKVPDIFSLPEQFFHH